MLKEGQKTIKVGRIAAAGLLATALAVPAGATISSQAAYAADGTVTITQQANADATYDAYRVFKADIDDTTGKATHITWENDAVKTAVENFIKADAGNWTQEEIDAGNAPAGATTTTSKYSGTTPQEAAEYINAAIAADPGINDPKWVDGGSFADKLAEAVSAVSSAKVGTATSGEAFTDVEGYYLFTTTPSTIGTNEMGTAPIWFPLGGTSTAINEKASAPTLTKEVKEDKTGQFGKTADAEIEQDVDFKITLTLPSNLNTLENFKGVFTDTLPAGATMQTSSVAVAIDGTDVTQGQAAVEDDPDTQDVDESAAAVAAPTISFTGGKLTVSHDDWKQFATAAAGKDIVVTYKAKLSGNSVVYGNDGNKNVVDFEYTNNPNADGSGTPTTTKTNEAEAKVFIYGVTVDKLDKATEELLDGAQFVIKNQEGKYLTDTGWDGAAEADGKVFTTTNGQIEIKGLDEGVYTLTETKAPDGYEIPAAAKDVTITITSTLPTTTADTDDCTLTATVSGGIAGTGLKQEPNSDDGIVPVKVMNDKQVTLAVTGAEGVGIAGVVVLLVGVGAYVYTRRRNASAEQE